MPKVLKTGHLSEPKMSSSVWSVKKMSASCDVTSADLLDDNGRRTQNFVKSNGLGTPGFI